MTYFQAIILGIVQGLTEFLPVSSSGHLVLVPFLLNWNLDPQSFPFRRARTGRHFGGCFCLLSPGPLGHPQSLFAGIKDRKPFENADRPPWVGTSSWRPFLLV